MVAQWVFGCAQAKLPIIYLGMPLTIKRPTRSDFMPLIEKIEKRLQRWQGKLITRGGRLQLINSVLASIPIYYMTCFVLPKWVINRIDLIRRRFLWGKAEGQGRGISLINWELVCTPKSMGGLGAPNLEIRNISLILRWWWKAYEESDNLWASTVRCLRSIGTHIDGPKIWTVSGSFFWQQLIKLSKLFISSTKWQIGSGDQISFWYDAWQDEPIRSLKDGLPRPSLQKISLRDAAPIITALAPEAVLTRNFNTEIDMLIWKWSHSGLYSASSFYKIRTTGGLIPWGYTEIWNSRVPSKVRIFAYLLLNDRILTHEIMLRRHMNCDGKCVLCNSCILETSKHLFFLCAYAIHVWGAVETLLGYKIVCRDESVCQTWDASKSICKAVSKRVWVSRFMSVIWLLWKQRNEKIFCGKDLPPRLLAAKALEEGALWLKFCGGAPSRMGIG